MVMYGSTQKSARLAKRVSDLQGIHKALELYRSDNEFYPIVASLNSECAIGGSVSPDNVIPGLVPKYLQSFPADPQMDKAGNTSCYIYISTSDGSGYKIIDYQISDFDDAADYMKIRGLIDPARDGGADSCRADGTNPEAWGFFTYNACAL